MPGKSVYHTKQGQELLNYLMANRGVHLTASCIREHFARIGEPMGMATVYRRMDRLVQEGAVRKYQLDSQGSACYEYVGGEGKSACGTHFHCKCEKCGELIHLDCDELQAIREHLLGHHGFEWNAGKTVFYGICEKCRGKADGGTAGVQ